MKGYQTVGDEIEELPVDEKTQLNHFFERFKLKAKELDIVYDLDKDLCRHVSPAFREITGLDCDGLFHDSILFLKNLIYPSDYSNFLSELIEFIKSKKELTGENLNDFEKSFSFRIKDQKEEWMDVNLYVLILSAGRIAGIIRKKKQKSKAEPLGNISPREAEVLKYIANGDSAKIIGDKLNISETTVITHRKHLRQKLNAKNTAELIKEAVKAMII
ncbi:LuxR C-terminal-related transcriptional regulator [Gaoshiqia sp. Z1-71]|uniref:LuxR C-terminal-related transcriptional regulator n=1 Tax=Gaoshiqia hydrogeniformans TaxID=3290090 RepID=UPI003BF8AFED